MEPHDSFSLIFFIVMTTLSFYWYLQGYFISIRIILIYTLYFLFLVRAQSLFFFTKKLLKAMIAKVANFANKYVKVLK